MEKRKGGGIPKHGGVRSCILSWPGRDSQGIQHVSRLRTESWVRRGQRGAGGPGSQGAQQEALSLSVIDLESGLGGVEAGPSPRPEGMLAPGSGSEVPQVRWRPLRRVDRKDRGLAARATRPPGTHSTVHSPWCPLKRGAPPPWLCAPWAAWSPISEAQDGHESEPDPEGPSSSCRHVQSCQVDPQTQHKVTSTPTRPQSPRLGRHAAPGRASAPCLGLVLTRPGPPPPPPLEPFPCRHSEARDPHPRPR